MFVRAFGRSERAEGSCESRARDPGDLGDEGRTGANSMNSANSVATQSAGEIPLVVDLDGTLVASDTLFEGALLLVREKTMEPLLARIARSPIS